MYSNLARQRPRSILRVPNLNPPPIEPESKPEYGGSIGRMGAGYALSPSHKPNRTP